MEILFTRVDHRDVRASVTRSDGVTLSVPVYGHLDPLPHDLAHYVVERHMGLPDGFWGTIAAGGIFRGMRVAAGRQPPHAAERSKAIIRANVSAIGLAEQVVGNVTGVLDGEPVRELPLSDHPRTPRSRADYHTVITSLIPHVEEMIGRWQQVPVGGEMCVQWPEAGRRRATRLAHVGGD
ncbi:MAG TPA: hypothetical protein VFB58_10520 [Chloroflexota bacterium]|nr:hypothetical protein [Chloroflexota bacterium]